jgi:magnesium transporter
MITEYKLPNFRWIDVQEPHNKELGILRDSYGVHYEILKDLNEPTSDTRIMSWDEQVYFTFHITSTLSLENQPEWLEIDIIIVGDTLITVTYDNIPAVTEIRRELEIEETLGHNLSLKMDQFLVGLIIRLHKDLRILIAALNAHQRRIDNLIFNGAERQMVRTISETGRILFSVNQTLAEQRHVVKFLPTTLNSEQLEFLAGLLRRWQRELEHTEDQTRSQYDLYHDLRRTNEELLATKQNEVMRKLTLVAFITSPLTILAGIFGMNTRNVPLIGSENDFWLVLGIMAIIVCVTMIILYTKGWFD